MTTHLTSTPSGISDTGVLFHVRNPYDIYMSAFRLNSKLIFFSATVNLTKHEFASLYCAYYVPKKKKKKQQKKKKLKESKRNVKSFTKLISGSISKTDFAFPHVIKCVEGNL